MGKAERRREKLRDIELDSQNNAVYTGDLFRVKGDVRAARVGLGTGLAALLSLVIASGCIDAAGAANTFYVIFPYIGEVSALFALCWSVLKILWGAHSLRKYVFDSASRTVPGATRVLTVFALFGLLASGIYLILNGFGGKSVKSIAYLALKIVTAFVSELYGRYWRGIEWEKIRDR